MFTKNIISLAIQSAKKYWAHGCHLYYKLGLHKQSIFPFKTSLGQNNNCNCPQTEADCISVMSNAAVTIFESKALFDISKQSSNFFSTFRNSLRNFEALFELSCENSILLAKCRSKFRLNFRGLARFFANGKTIAVSQKQRNFEENSFGSKYRSFSKVFETFRRNSFSLLLHNTVDGILIMEQ